MAATTPFDLSKRVAFVTGGNGGIGLGMAKGLAAAGASVVIAGRNKAKAEAALSELKATGAAAEFVELDVLQEASCHQAIDRTAQKFGRLDILINNAGAPQGLDRNNIEAVPVSAWDENMAINARGVFLMCRAAVTPMRAQHWGRIINVSSAAAKTGRKNMAVYAASKAAVLGFTRALGVEVAPYGITVNAICPYSVLTDRALSSAKRVAGGGDVDAALAEKARGIPVGRHGRPEDVAGMIQYLASDVSAFVTGQAISVCGGVT